MLDDLKVNDPRNCRRTEILEKKQGFRGSSQGGLADLVGIRGSGFHLGKCIFGDAMKLDGIC